MAEGSNAAKPLRTIMLEMLTGSFITQALHVASKLGIPDRLSDGPKQVADLAEATGCHAPSLYRLLRVLSDAGVFEERDNESFSLTPLGETLRSDYPGSVGAAANLVGEPFHWNSWGNLEHSIKTGEPAFKQAFGMELFDYLAKSPRESKVYNAWMARSSESFLPAILSGYDFASFGKVADIGGGKGALLSALLTANPNLHGILYDMASATSEAESLRRPPLAGRAEVIAGDFFKSVPAGAGLYILKQVIHDWDDGLARRILSNCRDAMSKDSKLILIEFVLPNGRVTHPGKLLDLNMLVLTNGGRERTEAGFRELFASAGLELTNILPTRSPISIIEGRRLP